jgi:GWxTD domain-containing protein
MNARVLGFKRRGGRLAVLHREGTMNKTPFLFLAAAVVLLAACESRVNLQLDPESRDFYETSRLVMTNAERDIFNHLPDIDSRREFIKDFWEKRDPDPTTEVNEFKEEFEKRIAYVNLHFKEGRHGIDTDRGRIYLYLGPPEKTEEYLFVEGSNGPVLWWIYYKYGLLIEFIDAKGFGSYAINEISGDLLGAVEMAKLGETFFDGGTLLTFLNFDLKYDKARGELTLSIPIKKMNFKEEEGALKADFDFEFYIYKDSGAQKEKFAESRHFEGKQADLEKTKVIAFTFRRELPPGKSYVDVTVNGKEMNGKSRKIFDFKI